MFGVKKSATLFLKWSSKILLKYSKRWIPYYTIKYSTIHMVRTTVEKQGGVKGVYRAGLRRARDMVSKKGERKTLLGGAKTTLLRGVDGSKLNPLPPIPPSPLSTQRERVTGVTLGLVQLFPLQSGLPVGSRVTPPSSTSFSQISSLKRVSVGVKREILEDREGTARRK